MDLSVIICTYNRGRNLARLLAQLSEQNLPATVVWEIVVVDNNSTDNTREIVAAAASSSVAPIRYLFESRQGKSHAMNRGVEQSSGAILLFTDDDVVLTPGWVGAVTDFFRRFDCAGMGGKVIPDFEGGLPPWLDADRPFPLKFDFGDEPAAIDAPPFGCNMAFRREVFDSVGRFRTDLGPGVAEGSGLGEDSDFGRRVSGAGHEIMYCPGAVVHHPIESQRSSRAYLIDWHFRYGQSLVIRNEIPKNGPEIAGVPRYLYRLLIENVLKWVFTLSPKRRFYNRLAVAKVLGTVSQFREQARLKKRLDTTN